jgi:ubiquinone/menaquinone biosynthesis C-methylase UbiE
MDKYKEIFYPEAHFGGFADNDGIIVFYNRVNALLQSSFVVLDVGCGRGELTEDPVDSRRRVRCLKGKVAKVIGLDFEHVGRSNPTIDEFRPIQSDGQWPVEDKSINLIICDSVLEHLAEPRILFREAQRVLTRGGFLCLSTTNIFGYVGAISKLVPNRFHVALLGQAQKSRRKEEDVFPTLYRCNTLRSIRKEMAGHGFRAVVYGHTGAPSYLNFSKLAYAAGVLHQKLAPSVLGLTIFAFGELTA